MKSILKTAFFLIIIIGIGIFSGCQKKVTKVEAPAPVTAKPSAAPEVQKPEALPPLEEFKPIDMDAQIREALQTVYFDFDKYDLRSDAVSRLEIVARYLQEHKTLRVLAEGHCDERGSSEYNMGLGENRARAVKKYLTSYGINQARLEITSYGKERLAKPGCGDDDFCNQANRRVEWKVLVK